jgi:hypothetical protein
VSNHRSTVTTGDPGGLTDAQTTAIVHATRPLQGHERAAFLAAPEALLADRTEIGDGELHRALRDLQRKHFRPPG